MVLRETMGDPPFRSPTVDSVLELDGRWWLAHTKSRFEKAFSWDLLARGIGYFLPLVDKFAIAGTRKRQFRAPLFTSYVFFCGSEEQRYEAMRTDRLCQVIPVSDQEGLRSELGALELALGTGAGLELHPFAEVGKRCRVKSGPFTGLEGVVVERRSGPRLVLLVSILGQGASLEIEADLLEPAG